MPRYAEHAGFLLIAAVGLLVARAGLEALPDRSEAQAAPAVSDPMALELPDYIQPSDQSLRRITDVHTLIPTRDRFTILKYVVQPGDTLFGISNRFGLQPETVLWGNFDVLEDNPHSLKPGQDLNILPVDGTFHVWKQGDGLIGVADFFGVSPQDILDWPGNQLPQDLNLINPDIAPGTPIVIPGGQRETVDWRAPRITRANPASARILGPGFCGSVYDGPVGAGFFVWPTPSHNISGYSFSPNVHPAIDIGGSVGNAIYAVDAGVVVYAGWHNGGYGNVVVIDHGNGWQSLYAHLNSLSTGCGDGLFQGNVIGGMGCTGNCSGNHLHFEMQHDQFGKINPLNFLP
ncbi:MAG: peptidoglycan DD-metalloendopeptidase family protein [Anaerolineales bacterium]